MHIKMGWVTVTILVHMALIALPNAHAEVRTFSSCESFAASPNPLRPPDLLSFLENLRQHQKTQELEAIHKSIISDSPLETDGLDQSALFVIYIWKKLRAASDHSVETIQNWFGEYKRTQEVDNAERDEVERITSQAGHLMIFHLMGRQDPPPPLPTFWLMETPVTEAMWLVVMGRPPLSFRDPSNQRPFEGKLKPVVAFSEDELREFFEKLKSMTDDPGSPIHKILPDHRPGDIYRLPSTQVILSLTKKLFENHADLFDKNYWLEAPQTIIFEIIHHYAWVESPSRTQTSAMPVGLKWPLQADGHNYFDLLGNVTELTSTQNVYTTQFEFQIWGSHWLTPPEDFRAEHDFGVKAFGFSEASPSFEPSANLGFRLYRYRSAPK